MGTAATMMAQHMPPNGIPINLQAIEQFKNFRGNALVAKYPNEFHREKPPFASTNLGRRRIFSSTKL